MLLRSLATKLSEALRYSPVVLIIGPRQAGKSTLALSAESDTKSLAVESLDIASRRAAAIADPDGFIADLEIPAVIDEIQKAPGLLDAIKARVDRDRVSGSFVLTGSANVLLLPTVSESLTGRIEILTLWPFSQGELAGIKEKFVAKAFSPKRIRPNATAISTRDLARRVVRGGFPEILNRPDRALRPWFESYISTTLNRDLRDLADVERIDKLPGLLRAIAARTRAPINKSSISSEIGLPLVTLGRYLTLLEHSFLVNRIPAFSRNIGRQLAKSPKYLVADTGLMATLLAQSPERLREDPTSFGLMLENFVGMELTKQLTFSDISASLNHFRAARGVEIDFVLTANDGKLVGIEVKAAGTVSTEDFRHLVLLREKLGDDFVRGVVLYTGTDVLPFGDRLAAWPVSALWAESWR